MNHALFAQGGSIKEFLRPNDMLERPFAGGSFDGINFETRTRIALLVASAVAVLAILGVRRLLTGVPFMPPADYRSFTIFNKDDFAALYGADQLPSKVPIEKLEGARRKWAWVQLICLIGLVVADAVLLGFRITQSGQYVEEAVELAYWAFMLAIFAFRFYATPYRPILFLLSCLGCLVPMVLVLHRDIWPKLLIDPPRERMVDARAGWGIYTRAALSVFLEACFVLTPREWYPVDPFSTDVAAPEQTAPVIEYFSYSWLTRLVTIAWKRDIEAADFDPLPDYDRARLWFNKYELNKKSTALKTMFALFRWDFLYMTLFSFAVGAFQFIWPMSMRELLAYIEKSKVPVITPWFWVGGLFFGPIATAAVWQGYIFNSTRLIIRIKAAFTQALLEKTLKIRFTSDEKDAEKAGNQPSSMGSKVGRINNMMSSDLQQLADAREFFMLVGTVPIEIILAVIFLYDLLGWSSLVGVALMIATIFVPVVLAKFLARIQKRLREATDRRIGLMVETMNSVRIIKYFGMEKPFLNRIAEKRDSELKLSLISAVYNLTYHTISTLLPIFNMLATFGIYTKVMKQPLTASIAFTAISLFDILRSQFTWMAFVSQQVLYAFVSLDRIDKFLNHEEELEQSVHDNSMEGEYRPPAFKHATLSWCAPGSEDDNNFRLSDINVECVPRGLTVISGPVGSGKTSFLMGILGEMRLLKGEINLPRKSGIAFAAQAPWLQCDTVRNNILFGTEYSEQRYQKVVEACALAADFEAFDAGDETEIGERGVSLSGGQKARIALARAVYSPAQTVILDDVLSALDAGTSKIVVEKCLKGDILSGRTVVLVTHHLSLVATTAKKVVVLADGCVVSDCTPQELPADIIGILKQDAQDAKAEVMESAAIIDVPPKSATPNGAANGNTNGKTNGKGTGKLVMEEAYGSGRMEMRVVWEYLSNYGGAVIICLLMLFNLADQLGGLANQYYVALWSDEYTNHPGHVNIDFWLGLYGAVLVGTTLLDVGTYGAWFYFQWLAAKKLHANLVKSVLYSPIRFFDTTPVGRIINRLSNDVRAIDGKLGPYLLQCIMQALEIVMRVVVMSGLIPAFLVPTVTVSILGIACGMMYAKAQIGVKRILSIRESPLMSHFGDAINGIVTIRAFQCQDRFMNENIKRIDDFSIPNEAYFNLNRWIGIRISWCTALIGGAAGFITLVSKGFSPGLIGFSLTNSLAFSGSVLSGVRYLNALEVEMNSYERVNEWVKLPEEETPTKEKEPPAAWPTQGDVQVRELSVKYSADGPEIGVVGRTGAGKSSLALSLLRFTHISNGSVVINGRDINNTNLEALRRRITIIPQDPVLFSGTIRSNLDPFGETDDTELQAALESCGLADPSEAGDSQSSGTSTPTGTKRITLDTPVTSEGSNLSQGQRQLLAFARGALVRRSKLVILDEATSSTDMKTDERIRELFNSNGNFVDSSFIMIAHRLRTVMQFDRILVLDNKGNGGEVAEFDTPLNLLNNEDGIFHNLARKSNEFEELLALARLGRGCGR
ncbi:P-loop containing nucleoside triphosphate hydrolase protein [Sphaerosporella brunnea]|uniref:P-loop containing nucleoside triphosphate hydrolase protein n=1 Tax=Sphaerosporella brunnea TaxID=1250544 RepID=A0A5J5EYG1_9PEZI|nr:P-loop containing nucleoside triphosphate hydrolase protein [Sphaerosporella brunnea]